MVTGKDLVTLALSQDGDRYIFGHEVKASDSNPSAFDCSELVEWACARLGVTPRMPDGSWYQARHCRDHNTLVTVAKAIETPGALLFSFGGGNPFSGGRPSSAHVAISQGNGKTIEARSSRHGVGQFSASGRGWTHAGLVPGIDYRKEDPMGTFKDVPESHTHYKGIERMAEEGIMSGFPDGTFRPNEPVTRAQLATTLSRILNLLG